MPLYDYRCTACEARFQARHAMAETAPNCPECGAAVQRLITTAPRVARGMLADAGDGGTASKDELRSKWAEEAPKLRRKLVDKLGEDVVARNAPTLNHNYE